jgi:hypothetical protein
MSKSLALKKMAKDLGAKLSGGLPPEQSEWWKGTGRKEVTEVACLTGAERTVPRLASEEI